MPDLRPYASLLFSGLGKAGNYNLHSSDFRPWEYLRARIVSGNKHTTLSVSCSGVGLLAPFAVILRKARHGTPGLLRVFPSGQLGGAGIADWLKRCGGGDIHSCRSATKSF